MLDLGWSELLVIGIVALIVVGPKDLPRMLRTLGQYAAKAKGVAREFQRSMDEAARQADVDELRDVKKDLDKDVAGMREQQYKMQREMSQSFMDQPGAKAKGAGKGGEKGAGKAETPPAEKSPAETPPAGKSPAGKSPAGKPGAPAEPAPSADEAGPAPRKASGA